jgi:hypothetical protein
MVAARFHAFRSFAPALVATFALAGCATRPGPPQWQALDTSWPAAWEVDRNSLTRQGDTATIVLRSSLVDSQPKVPRTPRVAFETPYKFDCRERTFVQMASRTYNPISGWRPLPGFDTVNRLDSAETQKYQPALYRAQVSAFAIACVPHPRPRPGNRI